MSLYTGKGTLAALSIELDKNESRSCLRQCICGLEADPGARARDDDRPTAKRRCKSLCHWQILTKLVYRWHAGLHRGDKALRRWRNVYMPLLLTAQVESSAGCGTSALRPPLRIHREAPQPFIEGYQAIAVVDDHVFVVQIVHIVPG